MQQKWGTQGYLTYFAPFNDGVMPSSMYLEAQDMIDLAIPIIYMGSAGDTFSFEGEDKLIPQSQIDWEAEKPNRAAWKGYYQWWVCWTFQGTGYVKQTLVWGTGKGKPDKWKERGRKEDVLTVLIDSPSCVGPVDVKRVILSDEGM
jgi:hypothetical protein